MQQEKNTQISKRATTTGKQKEPGKHSLGKCGSEMGLKEQIRSKRPCKARKEFQEDRTCWDKTRIQGSLGGSKMTTAVWMVRGYTWVARGYGGADNRPSRGLHMCPRGDPQRPGGRFQTKKKKKKLT